MTLDPSKELQALCRAMPVSRMLDYGMSREQAERAHRDVLAEASWDVCLGRIANDALAQARVADASGLSDVAAQRLRETAASLVFAQMAFNFDVDRKRVLYERMTHAFTDYAKRSALRIEKIETTYRAGRLFGWLCRTPNASGSPTVIVFGGMSGWSTAFLGIAQALCAAGLGCLLVDGPGQGESRLVGGVFLDSDVAQAYSEFVGVACTASGGAPVGIWGNSFGGLFAALTAAVDVRLAACCINGAPPRCEIPPFRTAVEQMAAMFGKANLDDVGAEMRALSFDPAEAPLRVPTLVVEGGRDPMLPLGTQAAFLKGNVHPSSRTMTWLDGEHTIYNHAAERNEAVSRWFVEALSDNGR